RAGPALRARRREGEVDGRAEPLAVALGVDGVVESAEDGAGTGLPGGDRPDRVAGQPGHACRLGSDAGHVAEHDAPVPGRILEDVVEVAADHVALAGGVVAG